MKETIEDNKLIAEFMQWSTAEQLKGGYCAWNEAGDQVLPEEMKFDSDWNWLMEVVSKISSIDSHPTTNWEIHAAKMDVLDSLCEVNINFTWEAVIEFIKTYNHEK